MKQVHLKLLLCLLLATSATGQAGMWGQNFGGQQLGVGQSSMERWGGFPGMAGAFGQQPGAASSFGSGLGQFGGGLGQFGSGFGQQPGAASQFGGGGFGQFGSGFGQQAGAASQFGGGGGFGQFGSGFGQQAGATSQFGAGFGQTGAAQQAVQPSVSQQTAVDTRTTGADVTSGTTQQYGSSVAVPATSESRSVSNNVCYNIIDSNFPSFSDYCSVLPQTTFSLPNFFGHQTKQAANDLLVSLSPALTSQCLRQIRMFTCPLFFPPCDSEAILPCASFCRAVKDRCGAFDLSAINCDQLPERSEFCPTITTVSRSFSNSNSQIRTVPYNNYGQGRSLSDDYSSTSALTRSSSSSYGGSGDQLVETRGNGGGYGLTGDSGAGSERSAFTSGASNQNWNIGDLSSSLSLNGGFSRAQPTLIKSGNSAYGSNIGSFQQDNSFNNGGNSGYGAPTLSNTARSFESTSYGNNNNNYGSVAPARTIVKSVESTSYGNNNNYGGGLSLDNTIKSGGSSYGNNNYGSGLSLDNTIKSGGSSSYGNNNYGSGLSLDNTIKSSGSSYGNNNYGSGLSLDNTIKSGGSSYGNNNYGNGLSLDNTVTSGGSSYGNNYGSVTPTKTIVKSVDSTSYGNNNYGSGLSFDNTIKSGGSSYGNNNYGSVAPSKSFVKAVGSTSYGSNNNYGGVAPAKHLVKSGGSSYDSGSSYGNTAKSAGSSYGNYNNYGSGSSYGNSGSSYGTDNSYGNYGGSYATGSPYGIQSTGEYNNYYPEKLDLSKCGPGVTENPCSAYGPQFYPLPGYPQCYIQCVFERPVVKPCPNVLVWNSRINVCDWPTVAENNYGGSSYGGSSYGTNNNYGGSSYGSTNSKSNSESSYSYGRKKRSTAERKKRFFGGPGMSITEVPIGPPLPGLLPLPGFSGPIGMPGPLIPPPIFPPFFPPFPPIVPPFFPPVPPIPPFFPPIVPPIGPIPPPIFPPPLVPPFMPPLVPPLPIPLGGPLLPPLPMSLPATFIPGPPPIFGPPLFGPFGGGLGSYGGPLGPYGGPFGPTGFGDPFFPDPFGLDFEFGGGYPFGDDFYGGYPGSFFEPFPYPGGYDDYDDYGSRGSYKGGHKGGYNDYNNGYKGGYNDYDNGYNKGYSKKNHGKSYNSYNDDYGSSKSNYKNNNYGNHNSKNYDNYNSKNYDNYNSKNYNNDYSYNNNKNKYNNNNGYSSSYSNKYNDDDGYYSSYRKRRQYGLNVDQDTSFTPMIQQRQLPQQFQTGYNPIQVSSYGLINQQQQPTPRLLPTNSFQTQTQFPSQPLSQPSPCIGKSSKSNIPHPTDSTKYIACLNEYKYEIMECPTGLIYNPSTDQCEKIKNKESICEREQPCLNDGQCYQTSPTTYKCTCRGSWTGERCETPLSSCAADPCGEGNECHTLLANDYKQDYVCVCDGRQSYGSSCGRNTVPNPCMAASSDQEQYHPFAFSAHAYVQCNGNLLYVRPCAAGLYWNQEMKICDREITAPARPAEDQPQSYQINYNTQSSYNRPSVSLTDQNVDRQQGLRYRNYSPHIITTDQSPSFNQINSRSQTPMFNSYASSFLPIQQSRRLPAQQQQQYSSIISQPSTVVNQQYSQPLNEQTQSTPYQGTVQRSMFRVFQPSRIANNLNTQSLPSSSSYRR